MFFSKYKSLCISAFSVILFMGASVQTRAFLMEDLTSYVLDHDHRFQKTYIAHDENSWKSNINRELFEVRELHTEEEFRQRFAGVILEELKKVLPGSPEDTLAVFADMFAHFDRGNFEKITPADNHPEKLKDFIASWNTYMDNMQDPDPLKSMYSVLNASSSPWTTLALEQLSRISMNTLPGKEYYTAFLEHAEKSHGAENQRMLWLLLNHGKHRSAMTELNQMASQSGAKIDPWLAKMINGRALNLASVTTYRFFREAHAMYPEIPDAAAALVAYHSRMFGGKSVYRWLKRVMELEYDNRVAFDGVAGLRHLQHFSDANDEILYIGEQCLKNAKPGTQMGLIGIQLISQVVLNSETQKLSPEFKKRNLPLVENVLDEAEKSERITAYKHLLPILRMNMYYYFNAFDKFFETWNTIDQKAYRENRKFATGGVPQAVWINPEKLEAAPNREFLLQCERFFMDGDRDKAAARMKAEILHSSLPEDIRLYMISLYGRYMAFAIPLKSFDGCSNSVYMIAQNNKIYRQDDARINEMQKKDSAKLSNLKSEGKFDFVPLVVEQIELGFPVNRREYDSEKGMTLLHFAAQGYGTELIGALLAKGADINIKGSYDGITPLHAAVKANELGNASYLLSKGAKVDGQDNAGNTAAHLAASLNNAEALKLLANYGANFKLKNGFGETVADVAKKHNAQKALEYLESLSE